MQMLLITENTDAMIGMRLAGVESVRIKTQSEALAAIEKASSNSEIGIILITSKIEGMCPEAVSKLKQSNRPLLSVIPDGNGSGRNRNAITDYIRDAIGIKI